MNPANAAPFQFTALVMQPPLDGSVGDVELVAFTAGPAGTAATDVHRDVAVEVDYAEPDRLCSIDAEQVGRHRSLEELIGSSAYRAMRLAMLQGSDRSQRISRGRPPRRGQRPITSLPVPDPEVRDFAISLAARAVGDDPFEPALVRAVAYLESAALLTTTPWVDTVDGGGLEEQLVFAAETLVQDVTGDQELGQLGLRDYEALRETLLAVARYPQWVDRPWAVKLRRRFPQRLFDLSEQRQRTTLWDEIVTSAPARMEAASVRALDHRAAPSVRDTVRRLGPGRYVFFFDTRPDGDWLRVVDRSSQALMALVPIARKGRRWEAHVVLPTNVGITSVVAEPTHTPIVASASTVDTMLAAVDHGRAAARLSAAGDPAAPDRWRLCAQFWTELGDDSRASRALAYATERERVTRPAFVHDAVRHFVE